MASENAPTLHEIAAMPYPNSVLAMREHYAPNWGKPVPDDGEKRSYAVIVRWIAHGSETYEVKAFTEEEAEELAADAFGGDPSIPAEAYWDGCTVELANTPSEDN